MKHVRKELQELDLINNFLFGSVLTHPVYGPRLGRILLEKMLGRKVGELVVTPQKTVFGSDTNLHGICLDVQLEETGDKTTVYDIEPELDSRLKSVKALPRRARFYHAKMTSRGLKSGEEYGALINEIIMFITPFDPFGLNRMLYTVKNCCVERPDMPYEDGALTLFFYTKGNEGIPSEEIKQLLTYMEDSSKENVTSEFLQEIHNMVEHVKHDEEVSLKYMIFWQSAEGFKDYIREEVREEVREEARKEGHAEGLAEGRAEGLSQGIESYILDNVEENVPKDRIIAKLTKIFSLSPDEAEVYYNKYCS